MASGKPSGLEMMVMNLMRAAGFDPQAIANKVQEFGNGIERGIADLNKQLGAIHEQQAIINARLERIETALQIAEESPQSGMPLRIARNS